MQEYLARKDIKNTYDIKTNGSATITGTMIKDWKGLIMYEISKELKNYVDDQFRDWDKYTTCNCSHVQITDGETVRIAKVETYINGKIKPEGEKIHGSMKSLDKAIVMTIKRFRKLEKSHKHIIVRTKPEAIKGRYGWYIYFRAAVL